MAAGFILMAIVIMIINYDRVPEMFGIIFKSAFGTHAAFGAMMGLAVEWGIKRGIYANEAGQGSGPHAAAASEVSHPAKQGYVQAFAIYFDTMMVCTATAFLILASGTYNVYSPAGASAPPIFQGLAGIPEGAGYAQAGVEAVLPGWGSAFVSIAIFFFAFTTIMAYYYMAETNLSYVNHNKKRPLTVLVLRLGIIGMVVFGAFHNATLAWALGDIGVGLMAWLNIIAILIIQKPAMLALRDYERQKKLGLDPVFDPDALGIKNADFWRQRKQESVDELRLYGLNAVLAAFDARPQALRKLYLLEARIPRLQPLLKWCVANRVGYRVVEDGDLNKLAGTTHHEGVVADVLRAPALPLAQWLQQVGDGPALALGLDGVGNPHNLGAILRSAAHFGAKALLLPEGSTLALSGAAARVAEGGAEAVPLVQLPATAQAMAQLRDAGFGLAATLVEGGDDVFRAALPARLVYVMGAEGEGMDPARWKA
ncbi:hypothetical protein G6F57_014366 [Rhizopus arrhizus]|nr:hypothetical protein G6F57_014366 [Rhizopus arrhizus]